MLYGGMWQLHNGREGQAGTEVTPLGVVCVYLMVSDNTLG